MSSAYPLLYLSKMVKFAAAGRSPRRTIVRKKFHRASGGTLATAHEMLPEFNNRERSPFIANSHIGTRRQCPEFSSPDENCVYAFPTQAKSLNQRYFRKSPVAAVFFTQSSDFQIFCFFSHKKFILKNIKKSCIMAKIFMLGVCNG